LFHKLFWVKPQPSKDNMTVVRAAGIQVRQQVVEKYFQYDLPSSNQDWKEIVLCRQPQATIANDDRVEADLEYSME
jgi:hypothetical protein